MKIEVESMLGAMTKKGHKIHFVDRIPDEEENRIPETLCGYGIYQEHVFKIEDMTVDTDDKAMPFCKFCLNAHLRLQQHLTELTKAVTIDEDRRTITASNPVTNRVPCVQISMMHKSTSMIICAQEKFLTGKLYPLHLALGEDEIFELDGRDCATAKGMLQEAHKRLFDQQARNFRFDHASLNVTTCIPQFVGTEDQHAAELDKQSLTRSIKVVEQLSAWLARRAGLGENLGQWKLCVDAAFGKKKD